ncbi:hypothetical protein Tco_0308458 [Tanacetum coccineum]
MDFLKTLIVSLGLVLIHAARRFKKKSVKRIVEKRVAKAIEEYEKTRADSNNTGGSGSANTGGIVAPDVQGCSYKTFMNGKALTSVQRELICVSRTENVWSEKIDNVFEICKCAEDDKVKFAVWRFDVVFSDLGGTGIKTEDKKLLRFMWQPRLRVEATLGTYHGAIGTRPPSIARSCPPRCGKCHKLGHQEGECRTRIPVARDNSLQNVTCFGCGNHGHYQGDDFPGGLKNRKIMANQVKGTEARGMVHALVGGETNQNFNNMEDDINA